MTCQKCGFDRRACTCGKKRNTSGDVQMFGNYTDWVTTPENFSMRTGGGTTAKERKFMKELQPIHGETILSWINRTDYAVKELIQYALHHHTFGTKKTWACHISSRYCIICVLCQQVEQTTGVLTSLIPLSDLSKTYFVCRLNSEGILESLQVSPTPPASKT